MAQRVISDPMPFDLATGDDFETDERRAPPLLSLIVALAVSLLMWAGIIGVIIHVLRWLR